MKRNKELLNRIAILALILTMLLDPSGVVQAGNGQDESKADPRLLLMAEENPDATFMVIVQKEAKNKDLKDVEDEVLKGGGQIKKELDFISSFSAELSGKEIDKLARNPLVRWISYDAPTFTAVSDPVTSTVWATSVGTIIANQFTNVANMVDSSGLGSNGSYGYRVSNGKGTFAGFNMEAVPGNAITKVEAVFYAYANASFSKDFKINAYVNGKLQNEIKVKTKIFANAVGASNAGLVYVDITAVKVWQWVDFYDSLELYVEHAGFGRTDTIYYDAVGLRVTSAPGSDASLDTLTATTIADSTVDGTKQAIVYNNVIGATQLWNTANKLQGKGVTVAVVDSGVYKTKDLDKRIKLNLNFNPSYHDGVDRYGHGTFVAGIIGGNGSQSSGKYIGVAPKATILNVRVADDQGMLYESDVVDSLQWVYDNKDNYNIRVVNLSLNSSVAQSYKTSPLCAAVEILWFNNIVVVVSAGNGGSGVLYPPANDPFVITVGATDDKGTLSTADDEVASFSAYGLTEDGFAKPDLAAPGRNIIGLLPENDKLIIATEHPANRIDKTYFKMSGTSISAPMVSGAVALLLQDEPNLNPDQVKYRLMATANKNWPGYSASAAGAGYLDIYAAVYGTTTQTANTGTMPSNLLFLGSDPISWASAGWNSAGWNSAGWNSAGWNSAGWNSAGWNSAGWNTDYWDQ